MLKSIANTRKMTAVYVTFMVLPNPSNSLLDTYAIAIRDTHCVRTIWINFVGGAMPTAVRKSVTISTGGGGGG